MSNLLPAKFLEVPGNKSHVSCTGLPVLGSTPIPIAWSFGKIVIFQSILFAASLYEFIIKSAIFSFNPLDSRIVFLVV
jgi:hypothetical protein